MFLKCSGALVYSVQSVTVYLPSTEIINKMIGTLANLYTLENQRYAAASCKTFFPKTFSIIFIYFTVSVSNS